MCKPAPVLASGASPSPEAGWSMASCCAGRGWLVLEDADLTESAGVNPEAAAARLPAVGATRVDPVLTDAIAGRSSMDGQILPVGSDPNEMLSDPKIIWYCYR